MTTAAPVSNALPTTDPVAVFITKLISQLTTGVAPDLIDAAAETSVPELAWPVVKTIFEWVIAYLAGKISVIEQEGAIKVLFAVEKDTSEYLMLKTLANYSAAQETGDPDAISKSLQDAVNQWGSTIHFGGVAPIVGS